MRFAAVVAAVLSVAAAAPSAEEEYAQFELEARNTNCAKGVHVIGVGGQDTTKGDLGYLGTLVHNITRAIPHSNYEQVGYPKGLEGPDAVAWATPRLRHRIQSYAKKCPKTKIVLATYSLGGATMSNVICGAPSTGYHSLVKRYMPHILANVVYGDLSFVPGRHYNRGTCTASPGKIPRLKPGKCAPYGQKTRSFCDFDDQNCCSGTNPAVHFEYPQKYDRQATKFVVSRWKRFNRNVKNGKVAWVHNKWTPTGKGKN